MDIIADKDKWDKRVEAVKKFATAINEKCHVDFLADGRIHLSLHSWFHESEKTHKPKR